LATTKRGGGEQGDSPRGVAVPGSAASAPSLRDALSTDPSLPPLTLPDVESRTGPRIAFVGGQPLVAEALTWLLSAAADFRVTGGFSAITQLLEADLPDELDLVLVDADTLPDLDALGGLRDLGPVKLVLLTDGLTPSLLSLALEQRAHGVLLKSESLLDLLAALRHIVSGHTVFPAGWQDVAAAAQPSSPGQLHALSPRQRQVLELLAAGRRNEEIASELFLSLNTVKFHVRAIFARLGVRNRVEAAQLLAKLDRSEH
jgi:DNA-binding NarL/FixJ family response regulator